LLVPLPEELEELEAEELAFWELLLAGAFPHFV
jgi:hypothetical protein